MTPRVRSLAAHVAARPRAVLIAIALVTAVSAVLASRLTLRTSFSSLLPQSQPSVRNLEVVMDRVPALATMFVLVEADDPALRTRAADTLARELEALGPTLVASVVTDDTEARQYYWRQRFLFVDLGELQEIDDALAERAARARLDANPLYIDLEDDAPPAEDLEARLDELREQSERAKRALAEPSSFLSEDGRLQLVLVRAAFEPADVGKGGRLVAETDRIASQLEDDSDGAVTVGKTGNVVTTLGEHRLILRGMLLATVVTCVLVALVLIVHLRSLRMVAAVCTSLAVGCTAAFALTAVFIGHLNLATSFLAAIVIGNGINPSIMVASRFLEERRRHAELRSILHVSLAGTLPGTVAASLTGAVAYGSLIVTDFRGFRHFGIIGSIGMVTCWIAAYTCLPAILALLHRRLPTASERRRWTGWIRVFVPRRRWINVALLSVASLVAVVASLGYVLGDPLETDWRNLRSLGDEVLTARAWNDRLSDEFERGFNRNLSGRFVIAGDRREDATAAADALREARDSRGEGSRIGEVRTVAEVWPPQQQERLAVLASIRARIDDILPELEGDEAELARELRPPEDLGAVAIEDIPDILRLPFTEREGSFGRIAWASSSDRVQSWNVRDLVDFAAEVRSVALPADSVVAGQAFVFADMLRAMERDIPIATLVVIAGAMICVLVIVGPGRWGWLVLGSSAIGTVGMVALASAVGLRVNFLDFIALPITVGIGIDYAANLAARARLEPELSAPALLATAGGAVVVCSLTTIIGYGSLLLSENAGIRSFGLASVLGEITCLAAALWLIPAATRRGRGRKARDSR